MPKSPVTYFLNLKRSGFSCWQGLQWQTSHNSWVINYEPYHMGNGQLAMGNGQWYGPYGQCYMNRWNAWKSFPVIFGSEAILFFFSWVLGFVLSQEIVAKKAVSKDGEANSTSKFYQWRLSKLYRRVCDSYLLLVLPLHQLFQKDLIYVHFEYLRYLSLGEFYFGWLENSVTEIRKAAWISLIFNHLKWNPS